MTAFVEGRLFTRRPDLCAGLAEAGADLHLHCWDHRGSGDTADDGDRIRLIDCEYAGFNSPLFDLGGLAANNELDAGEERRMLERYFGTPSGEARLASYAAMKCASALREAMWSMVSETRSGIDFDHVAYAAGTRPPRQWPGRKGLAREAGKFTFCMRRFREMSTSTRIVAR